MSLKYSLLVVCSMPLVINFIGAESTDKSISPTKVLYILQKVQASVVESQKKKFCYPSTRINRQEPGTFI